MVHEQEEKALYCGRNMYPGERRSGRKATTSPAPMTVLPRHPERGTATWVRVTSPQSKNARRLTRLVHHVCVGYAHFWSFFPPLGMPTWVHEQVPYSLWALARDQNDLTRKVQHNKSIIKTEPKDDPPATRPRR